MKVINLIKILSFLFIIPLAHANYELEVFCFDRSVNLDSVKNNLSSILLPKDQVGKRELGHCLEVETTPQRAELIKAYLMKFYGSQMNMRSAGQVRRVEPCRVKVEIESENEEDSLNIRLGKNSKARAFDSQKFGKTTSELVLAEGKPGILYYDESAFNITCSKAGSQNYNLEIYLRSTDGPGELVTSVTVSKHQKTELGQVINEYKDRKKDISIPKGARYKKESIQKKSKFFITVI